MRPHYLLIALLLVTIFFLIEIFSPFLKAIVVALLLTIATSSIYNNVDKRVKNSSISSTIMTIGLAILFFLPVLYFILFFATYLHNINQQELANNFEHIKAFIKDIPDDFLVLKEYLNDIVNKTDIAEIFKNIFMTGAQIGKKIFLFITDTIMILIFFFLFNIYRKNLLTYIKDLLPLKREDSNELFYEVSNVMSIVFYSILITAIFEGMLFGVFISFFEYDGVLFGVLYGFASLVPIIGGIIMWLPLSLYELFNGDSSNAIIIALYTIIVISIIADTIIKPIIIKYINKMVVKTPTKINELLIFFSIIAGLGTFGFWGMIIGPAMVTFTISLLQLLKKHSTKE